MSSQNQKDTNFSTIRLDPFINDLLERIPTKYQDSFSDEQLISLKVALSGRKWGKHGFDIRGIFGIWNWRYYYVIVGGREKRLLTRREKQLARVVNTIFLISFFAFSTFLGLVFIYLLDSALGINLFSDSYLGYGESTWRWLRDSIF